MSKKKDTWKEITRNLETKLSKSEFRTWFSHTTLKRLDSELAVIDVPNKFFARWLRDMYLTDIKKSFRTILKQSPKIHFTYNHPLKTPESAEPQTPQTRDLYLKHNINPSMTFNAFLSADCNRLACSSALEVANRPADQYNPLYIFSELGLGKTHLLNAIGNHVLGMEPFSRIKYFPSDTFTSHFTYSLRKKKLQEFRDEYCNLDFLLFDDVQRLANRKRTQEEFLFIFNALYGAKRQIVVTSNRPPNQLKNISSRIKSRLGWGLLTEIQPPDQATKIKIIKKKAKEDSFDIPDDVTLFLAKSNSDLKTLIRKVVRLEAYASLNNGRLNISSVKSLIKDKNKTEIGIEDIKSLMAGYFNISQSELVSNKKQRAYSYPRHLAMYLCRKYTDASFKEIGDAFGHKDHSTVIYALRRIEKYRTQRKQVRDDLVNIENLLG